MGTPATLSEATICNMALGRIGSTQIISAFDGSSNEAIQCAFWYPADRDQMLAEFPWPWAEAYSNLVEVTGPETTQTRANAQWMRSFRYPTDCLKLRRLVLTPQSLLATSPPQTTGLPGINYWCNETWRRVIGDALPVSYGLGNDASGRLIMTDFYGAQGITAVYTQAVSDPTQFEADFQDALAWRLARDLAKSLSFSDKVYHDCKEMAEMTARSAHATAMNSLQSDVPWLRNQAEVIRRRWMS